MAAHNLSVPFRSHSLCKAGKGTTKYQHYKIPDNTSALQAKVPDPPSASAPLNFRSSLNSSKPHERYSRYATCDQREQKARVDGRKRQTHPFRHRLQEGRSDCLSVWLDAHDQAQHVSFPRMLGPAADAQPCTSCFMYDFTHVGDLQYDLMAAPCECMTLSGATGTSSRTQAGRQPWVHNRHAGGRLHSCLHTNIPVPKQHTMHALAPPIFQFTRLLVRQTPCPNSRGEAHGPHAPVGASMHRLRHAVDLASMVQLLMHARVTLQLLQTPMK